MLVRRYLGLGELLGPRWQFPWALLAQTGPGHLLWHNFLATSGGLINLQRAQGGAEIG